LVLPESRPHGSGWRLAWGLRLFGHRLLPPEGLVGAAWNGLVHLLLHARWSFAVQSKVAKLVNRDRLGNRIGVAIAVDADLRIRDADLAVKRILLLAGGACLLCLPDKIVSPRGAELDPLPLRFCLAHLAPRYGLGQAVRICNNRVAVGAAVRGLLTLGKAPLLAAGHHLLEGRSFGRAVVVVSPGWLRRGCARA
jgi:hypothetical protein